MNHKSNKIFTKSCAAILAVSNIFSGVSAKTPAKTKSSSISLTPTEWAGSILGAACLSAFAAWFLPKKFSTQSTTDVPATNVQDSAIAQEVSCIIEALNHADHNDDHQKDIDKRTLFTHLNVPSDSAFLKRLYEDASPVTLPNGNEFQYHTSSDYNPSQIGLGAGNLTTKLGDFLQSFKPPTNLTALVLTLMQIKNGYASLASYTCHVYRSSTQASHPFSNSSFDPTINLRYSAYGYTIHSTTPIHAPVEASSPMLMRLGWWEELKTLDPENPELTA